MVNHINQMCKSKFLTKWRLVNCLLKRRPWATFILDLTITDAYGNGLDLCGLPYISVLEFGVLAVPENLDPLVPFAFAILILVLCVHRKDVRKGLTAGGRPTE